MLLLVNNQSVKDNIFHLLDFKGIYMDFASETLD